MWKRALIAILVIFVTFSVMDFLMHGVILREAYLSTAKLWRPMDEMKASLIYFTTLVFAAVFVCVYTWFFEKKGIGTGVKYGLLLGVGVGIPMGYGTYAVVPIPYYMALTWFLGTVAETTVGGLLLGVIVKE